MPAPFRHIVEDTQLRLARIRAKLLAREDRQLKRDLIRLRESSGLSQREVAERIGITQQAVNKFERYDSDPKASTIRRYANAVGALVEHRVTLDVGQSEWIASAGTWEQPVESVRPISASSSLDAPTTSTGWSELKRTDFTLAN
jgi:transcriptional regulator with XRE-family HTH domain